MRPGLHPLAQALALMTRRRMTRMAKGGDGGWRRKMASCEAPNTGKGIGGEDESGAADCNTLRITHTMPFSHLEGKGSSAEKGLCDDFFRGLLAWVQKGHCQADGPR